VQATSRPPQPLDLELLRLHLALAWKCKLRVRLKGLHPVREVQKLKAERDILKKAAAYFAKEST
jgi:hypothetical protein